MMITELATSLFLGRENRSALIIFCRPAVILSDGGQGIDSGTIRTAAG